MPTVELDIRQLADEGGTEPFAPITVTDAVLDEDGNTLTDTLDEIKSGLTTELFSLTSPYNQYTSGQGIYIPQTKTVIISFRCASSSDISMGAQLAIIPEKYRPKQNVSSGMIFSTDTGNISAGEFLVSTTGAISQQSTNYLRVTYGVLLYSA